MIFIIYELGRGVGFRYGRREYGFGYLVSRSWVWIIDVIVGKRFASSV